MNDQPLLEKNIFQKISIVHFSWKKINSKKREYHRIRTDNIKTTAFCDTPPKFNIAPQKLMVGRFRSGFLLGETVTFQGRLLLNFQGVNQLRESLKTMDVSKNRGKNHPKWMVKIMENPIN